MRCWNKVAHLAGFDDIEQLISDMVLFDDERCTCLVVLKGQGYAPEQQKTNLLHRENCQNPGIDHINEKLDPIRREAAKLFLTHLHNSTTFFPPIIDEKPSIFKEFFLCDDMELIARTNILVPSVIFSVSQKWQILFTPRVAFEAPLHRYGTSQITTTAHKFSSSGTLKPANQCTDVVDCISRDNKTLLTKQHTASHGGKPKYSDGDEGVLNCEKRRNTCLGAIRTPVLFVPYL